MSWPGVMEGGLVGGRMTLLIAASLDEGVMVYEFGFKQVVGLRGAAAVTLAPQQAFLYVAAEDDKAMTVFAVAQRYDVTQRKGSMFRQIQVLSEEPLEGGDLIRTPIAKGMRGIRELTYSVSTDCTGYRTWAARKYMQGEACSTILLRGGVPRSQLPCGEMPPVQLCSPTTPVRLCVCACVCVCSCLYCFSNLIKANVSAYVSHACSMPRISQHLVFDPIHLVCSQNKRTTHNTHI